MYQVYLVPGWTAETYPERIEEIVRGGHEVGHHGYHHVPPVTMTVAEQREDFRRGFEAIAAASGTAPRGYRSPSWQLTPVMMSMLSEFDFLYDSSCMGDDRPYLERRDGMEVLELPVHWALDDFPHLGWMTGHSGPLRDPREMFEAWQAEVEAAVEEHRTVVLTCHPEMTGRAAPAVALRRFLAALQGRSDVRFARCIEVAEEASKR